MREGTAVKLLCGTLLLSEWHCQSFIGRSYLARVFAVDVETMADSRDKQPAVGLIHLPAELTNDPIIEAPIIVRIIHTICTSHIEHNL